STSWGLFQFYLPSRPRHRLFPPFIQTLALALLHLRLEAFFLLPLRGDLFLILPEADGQPGQVSRAERRRFSYDRAHDGDAKDVGLELAEEVVVRRAAVNAQFLRPDPRILLHALDHVARLVGHRF